MLNVEVASHFCVNADKLWREVGSFQGVGNWHPMLTKVEGEGEQPGALRTVVARNGQKQVERLQETGTAQHFYRYTVVSSAMPVRDYVAEFRVCDSGDGTSILWWTCHFEVTSGDEARTVGAIRSSSRVGESEEEVITRTVRSRWDRFPFQNRARRSA